MSRPKISWLEDVKEELFTEEVRILANSERANPIIKRHKSGFEYDYYSGSQGGRYYAGEPLFALKYNGLYRQAVMMQTREGSWVIKVIDHVGERAYPGHFTNDKLATSAILTEFQKEFAATLKKGKK